VSFYRFFFSEEKNRTSTTQEKAKKSKKNSLVPASLRGPTGLFESSAGEHPVATSASSERESFLSRPASLPADERRGRWLEVFFI